MYNYGVLQKCKQLDEKQTYYIAGVLPQRNNKLIETLCQI